MPQAPVAKSHRQALYERLKTESTSGTVNLSHAQRRLWFLSQFEQPVPTHNLIAYELHGQLNLEWLQLSLDHVIQGHEMLCSTFASIAGRPVRNMLSHLRVKVDVVDLVHTEPAGRPIATQAVAHELAQKSFDLVSGPLVRVALVVFAPEHHVLFIGVHKIAADVTSLRKLAGEVVASYDAVALSRPMPGVVDTGRFSKFLDAEARQLALPETEALLRLWRDHQANASTAVVMPDHPHPSVRTHHGKSAAITIPSELVHRFEQQFSPCHSSRHLSWLALFQGFIARQSGQPNTTIGVPVDTRMNCGEGDGCAIGPYENMLALRETVDGEQTFASLVQHTIKAWDNALAFKRVPFEYLISQLDLGRDLSTTPLFQTTFEYEDATEDAIANVINDDDSSASVSHAQRLRMTRCGVEPGITLYDLTFKVLRRADDVELRLIYNSDLFEASTVDSMLCRLHVMLQAMVDKPDRPMHELPWMTVTEIQQLTIGWSQNPHNNLLAGVCLHELFASQAAQTPDATAVVCGGQRYSYAALNRRANQIAHHLRALGVGMETRVAIVADRSVDTIIALFAVLKAGGAYVPLDPAYPSERLQFMLSNSAAKIVLSKRSLDTQTLFANTTDCGWVWLDDSSLFETYPENDPSALALPDSLANIIFTSGSSGKPKGVLVPHRQLVNATFARFVYDTNPMPRSFLLLVSPSFDAAGVGIFWTLCGGSRLVIPTAQELGDPTLLRQLIETEQVTHFDWPSSLYATLLAEGAEPLRSLRHVIVAGEACQPQVVAQHFNLLPNVRLINEYGPTETSIWCTSFDCQPDHSQLSRVPIGRPVANACVYILDNDLRPVPVSVAGELYVGGDGVTRGYLNQPALTAERFVPNPFTEAPGERMYKTGDLARFEADGNIVFLGRADSQVKLRGYRIELEEIEAALMRHPGVAQAVVVVREDTPGNPQLTGYVTCQPSDAPPTQDDLITFLDASLPAYMVPRAIVRLDVLPHTPNGKLDRRVLPHPDEARGLRRNKTMVKPQTPLETEIAAAFAAVLGKVDIGRFDDFFDLGGNSLLVARLVSRLTSTYGIRLPVAKILQVPTVQGVARIIEAVRSGRPDLEDEWGPAAMEAEVKLDSAIRPDGIPHANWFDPDNVLLTGVTGYLGSFLLESLLRDTSAQIFCLVRAATEAEGLDRIRKTLTNYHVWDDTFEARIRPVLGDLARPAFGLSGAQWDALSHMVDVIYHSGALVNFVYPYSALKAANVTGTEEVLRLACRNRLKAVHFISSIDVLLADHAPRPMLEKDLPRRPSHVIEGYGASKWVSEKVVALARERGIPVCIYRPGLMMSHSKTGASHTSDYMLVALNGFLKLGAIPEIERLLTAIPIDFAADAIVAISRRPAAIGEIFHLWNTQPATFDQVYDWIHSFGYSFTVEPYATVRARALTVEPSHPLYPILPLFTETIHAAESTRPESQLQINPADESKNTLRLLEGSGLVCPPVDESFIHRCLSYLVATGYLPAP
jgi:amino acid adenylation domain-containing protein/thioester reductase-like protein